MIRIQNIYHMLAYAFQVLREQGYRDVTTEEFTHTGELCAAILTRGINTQLKRGLGREYVSTMEPLSCLRGKIEVTESVKTRSVLRSQLICSYDEFSVDNAMNRIIKATCLLLLRSDISKTRKRDLKRLVAYFGDVTDVDLATVDWRLRFGRNDQTYRMLINICWLVYKGLLQTQTDGSTRLMDFLDEQRMSRLYERFILEYYRREHPGLEAGSSHIGWALDDGFDDMLPVMKSDVTLSRGDRVLIIDAKYYSHTMQERFDKRSIHSSNLYQIFTYVKNRAAGLAEESRDGIGVAEITPEVSGMLLYAGTDEEIQPDGVYRMSGNTISVKTLDLNRPFGEIREQLDAIVENHFSDVLASRDA